MSRDGNREFHVNKVDKYKTRKTSTRREYNHAHQTQRDRTLSKLFCFQNIKLQLLGTLELSLRAKFQVSIFDDGAKN